MSWMLCSCGVGNYITTKSIRLSYVLIVVLYCAFLLVMFYVGDHIEKITNFAFQCPKGEASLCYGISVIVRVSVALLLMHFFLLLMMFEAGSFAKVLNESGFGIKFFLVGVIAFALMFVPNNFMRYYVSASRFVGLIFFMYQSVSLIDFGYAWNESWVKKYEEGRNFYAVVLVLFTVLNFASGIALLVFNFAKFWGVGSMYYNVNLILNCAIPVAMVALVVAKYNIGSSVLTSSFIFCLLTYMNGLSLASFDSPHNPYQEFKK